MRYFLFHYTFSYSQAFLHHNAVPIISKKFPSHKEVKFRIKTVDEEAQNIIILSFTEFKNKTDFENFLCN